MTRAKRGISDLIATVLLVLIVIAAIGIIWTAIAPMLKISPKVIECPKFDLSVNTDEGYSWYNQSYLVSTVNSTVQVMINAGGDVIKSDLKDIQIKVRYGGKSETFTVTDALYATGRKTNNGVSREQFLPGPNEDAVYHMNTTSFIAKGTPVSVSVAAIIKPAAGEKITTCDMSTSVEIPEKSEV